ncbi:MAG: hypothetical protein LUH02_10565 [Erysipelotrichaceae bacterium]|nr:hypothetical protein [Erysipelotrichaceae bacterium]
MVEEEHLCEVLYELMKDYIWRSDERYEGANKERERHRQNYYERVLKRFKMNYGEDPMFLKDLSLEAYRKIYEMIIDSASIDEIMFYVNSIK